jgi:hypothetical protein
MASRRVEVEIMPQGMVVRNLPKNDCPTEAKVPQVFQALRPLICRHLFRHIMNGNAGQAPSPYNPKYLLLKMPYRFNTSYQLLARSSAFVQCDWSSLEFRRSRL